jgi:hypothetical protein
MGRVIIGMDPHKRSATIEVNRGFPDRSGRSRAATALAGILASGCSLTVRPWSMCRRSYRRGHGYSPPARAARLMPLTPTRWPSSRCAPKDSRLLRLTARPSRCGFG